MPLGNSKAAPNPLSRRDTLKIAQRFNAGFNGRRGKVPKGRLNRSLKNPRSPYSIRFCQPELRHDLARIFHTRRSRRREEADGLGGGTSPPPYVGGYGLWAVHARYEICGLEPFSRPCGTYATAYLRPGVETPGYCRSSLRD